jgi:fumarylacetoacetate (FAA) hydrolase
MRLVTYRHLRHGGSPVAGVLQGDRVLNAARLLGEDGPLDMLGLLDRGPAALAALAAAAEAFAARHRETASLPAEVVAAAWEAELLAPLPRPHSLRDFYAFEQHVATAYRSRGREVPPAWYEIPVFYFGHAGSIVGPDAPVRKPATTEQLDF